MVWRDVDVNLWRGNTPREKALLVFLTNRDSHSCWACVWVFMWGRGWQNLISQSADSYRQPIDSFVSTITRSDLKPCDSSGSVCSVPSTTGPTLSVWHNMHHFTTLTLVKSFKGQKVSCCDVISWRWITLNIHCVIFLLFSVILDLCIVSLLYFLVLLFFPWDYSAHAPPILSWPLLSLHRCLLV